MLQAQKVFKGFQKLGITCACFLTFVFWIYYFFFLTKNDLSCCWVWAFLFVFFVFVSLRTIISVVFMRSSNLLTNRSIYLHCFIWMIMKEETLHDQFQHPSSLLCLDGKNNKLSYFPPPVWGVILVKVISKKRY